MLTLFIAGLLQITPALAATDASNTVEFSQQDKEWWAVQISGSGHFKRLTDSVIIDLDQLKLYVAPERKTWKSGSYRICLAYYKSATIWDKAGCSNPVVAKFTLSPGESKDLAPQQLEIPTQGYPPVENFWLVLELSSQPKRGRTYTIYAHSPKNLFKAGR